MVDLNQMAHRIVRKATGQDASVPPEPPEPNSTETEPPGATQDDEARENQQR